MRFLGCHRNALAALALHEPLLRTLLRELTALPHSLTGYQEALRGGKREKSGGTSRNTVFSV